MTSTLRAVASALAALGLLAACLEPPSPPVAAPAETPATTAITPTAANPVAAPTPAPTPAAPGSPSPPPEAARLPAPVAAPPVPVIDAQALIPGASTALQVGELATIDPPATFRVRLRGPWPDARLSLLEPGDAMVASAGAREVSADTTVTLQPAAPLKAATHYRLRVDGATTRELKAADGTSRAPVEFPLLITGDPAPEPKSRSKKPRR